MRIFDAQTGLYRMPKDGEFVAETMAEKRDRAIISRVSTHDHWTLERVSLTRSEAAELRHDIATAYDQSNDPRWVRTVGMDELDAYDPL